MPQIEKAQLISDLDFSDHSYHMAFVGPAVGGPANLKQTILTKSVSAVDSGNSVGLSKAIEEVTVTLSFTDFLRKFFDIYGSDANSLAELLGYDTDEYWADYKPSALQNVQLLKSFEGKTEEEIVKGLENLKPQQALQLLHFQSQFEKSGSAKTLSGEATDHKLEKKASETNEVDKSIGDDTMPAELEKAAQETADLKAQLAELEKANKEILESNKELQKARFEIEKSAKVEFVKGFSFVNEDQAEGVAMVLLKAADADTEVVANVLAQAKAAIEASGLEKAAGSDGEGKELTAIEMEDQYIREALKKSGAMRAENS